MLTVEPNGGNLVLTSEQFTTIVGLVMQEGLGLEYEIVEHDQHDDIVWFWVHHKTGYPTRYWIDIEGEVLMSETAHWQPTYEEAHPVRHAYSEGGTGCCGICEDPMGVGQHRDQG